MAPISAAKNLETSKPLIQSLLSEKQPQDSIREELRRNGVIVSKSKLEYQLKKWGIRVNLTKDAWKYVDHQIKKRKRQQGKESDVIVSGARLPPRKVLKETNRYSFDGTLERFLHGPKSPEAPADLPLTICTPPVFRLEFSWPPSMPWLQFQRCLYDWNYGGSTRSPEGSIASRNLPGRTNIASNVLINSYLLPEVASGDIQHVALKIGSVMPETYNGEHLTAASNLVSSDETLRFYHGTRLLLFALSNNLLEYKDGKSLINLLRNLGTAMGALPRLVDGITARAVIEKAFTLAIEHDADDVIKILMQSGLTPSHVRQDLPLTLAITSYRDRALRVLLDEGAEVDSRTLIAALENGNVDVVRLCLERGVDPKILLKRERAGCWFYEEHSVLTAAIALVPFSYAECNTFIVEELIKAKHSVSINSLVAASGAGKVQIVRLLCDHGVDINGTTDRGVSPLQAAAHGKKDEMCAFLLKLGAHTVIPVGHPQHGKLPSALHALMLALDSLTDARGVTTLNVLLDAGVNPDYCIYHDTKPRNQALKVLAKGFRCYGEPPASTKLFRTLHTALEFGLATRKSEQVIMRLLDTSPILFGTELILGSYYLSTKAIERLLARGLNLDVVNLDGNTALSTALEGQNVAVAKLLLRHGAHIRPGDTLLAFRTTDPELQKDILRLGGNIHEKGPNGKGLIEAAIGAGATATTIAEILARQPALYNGRLLYSVTLRAVSDEYPEYSHILEKLLRSRIKNTKYHARESAAIAIAAALGRLDLTIMFKKYISHTKDFRVDSNFLSDGLYSFGFESENKELVRLARKMTRYGWMRVAILSLAVMARTHTQKVVKFLLRCGYLPDETTLVLAIWQRKISDMLFQKLVRMVHTSRNQSRWVRASWGPSPLQMAVYMGDTKAVEILLEEGFEVEESPSRRPWYFDFDQLFLLPRTALQFAVEEGNLEMIDLLIKAGASINAPAAPASGATALQLASIRGRLGIARKLVELGANINAKGADRRGRTALEGAAEHGRIDMLSWLLASGASTVGEQQRSYIRAVRFAERRGHYAAARLLREYREWEDTDYKLYVEVRKMKRMDKDFLDEDWLSCDESWTDDEYWWDSDGPNEDDEEEDSEDEDEDSDSAEDYSEGSEDSEDSDSEDSDSEDSDSENSDSEDEEDERGDSGDQSQALVDGLMEILAQWRSRLDESYDGFDIATEETDWEPALEPLGASTGVNEPDHTIMAPAENCVRFEEWLETWTLNEYGK